MYTIKVIQKSVDATVDKDTMTKLTEQGLL